MKKLLKIILGLVCLLVLSVPVALTMAVKQASLTLVDELNRFPGTQARILNNRQGYFSSDADIQIQMANSRETAAPLVFNLQLQMQHGPLIWSPRLTFGWAHVTLILAPDFNSGLQALLTSDANGAFYRLEGDVNFLGELEFTDRLAAFALTLPSVKINTSQSLGEGRLNILLKKLVYNGGQSQLTLENNDFHLAMANPRVVKNIHWRGRGITFDNAVSFDALIEDLAANVFIKKGRIGFAGEPDPSKPEQNIGLSLAAAEWRSSQGPFNNLDIKLLITQVPDQFFTQLAMAKQPEPGKLGAVIFDLVKTHLLPANPQLVLEHLLIGPEGKTARMALTGNLPPALPLDWAELQQAPSRVMPFVTLKGDVAVDKVLLETSVQNLLLAQLRGQRSEAEALQLAKSQSQIMSGLLVGQGLVVDDKGIYKTRLGLERGVLTLNDKPFVLPF